MEFVSSVEKLYKFFKNYAADLADKEIDIKSHLPTDGTKPVILTKICKKNWMLSW